MMDDPYLRVTKEDFSTQAGVAAARFQILEQVLKVYLSLCFDIIRKQIPGFHFEYRDKDIANLPLGRLNHMFIKYNSNTELHKELTALRDKRNYIAHRVYMAFMGNTNPDADLVVAEIKKIQTISNETDHVAEQVLAERDKINKQFRKT